MTSPNAREILMTSGVTVFPGHLLGVQASTLPNESLAQRSCEFLGLSRVR
jgi:hypothetical protein